MNKFKLMMLSLFALLFIGINGSSAQCQMTNNPSQGSEMMAKHQQIMLQKLGSADKNYDLRFINMMIMHHQGKVMMAQDALQKAQHTELKHMAQDVINCQAKEIEQMKAWRKQWYGQ
jgi:uncharacterized protein (DUF305 family)